jgi:uncharacterized protein (TIGR03083 family)
MAATHRDWIRALRDSHDRLVSITDRLSPEEIAGPSYCSDWSIAQVLSHLGSGAEIGRLGFEAALRHDPPPPREANLEIWARWDALSPAEMASQAIASDSAQIERLESLDEETLDTFRMMAFNGREVDISGAVALRLHEHAAHTWDVEVMLDRDARVLPSSIALLTDRLPERLGRLARGPKPDATPTLVAIESHDPSLRLVLSITPEEATLAADGSGAETRLSLSAEALFRLALGRLDPDHTPSDVSIDGVVSLDELRRLFLPT